MAKLHATCVDAGEAVHILLRLDGVDDLVLVNVFGQGQLDDVAVNLGIVVEEFDHVEHLFLGGAFGQAVDR